MKKEIENWWNQAKRDLKAAENSLKTRDFDWASFQSEQAAEKALKALYIEKYNEIRKIHDLVLLARKLELPTEIIDSCIRLNKVYIETRYPDASDIIPALKFSQADAQKFIDIANKYFKMEKKKIIKKLQKFRTEVSKDIPIDRMIFFGSRAWGKPHKDSDIDLIIVSSKFRRKRSLNRGLNLYKYWNLDYPVDFLCYTPEEFSKLSKQTTIVKEAKENGISISV
jgi:uncharacterized protein